MRGDFTVSLAGPGRRFAGAFERFSSSARADAVAFGRHVGLGCAGVMIRASGGFWLWTMFGVVGRLAYSNPAWIAEDERVIGCVAPRRNVSSPFGSWSCAGFCADLVQQLGCGRQHYGEYFFCMYVFSNLHPIQFGVVMRVEFVLIRIRITNYSEILDSSPNHKQLCLPDEKKLDLVFD